MDSHVSLQVAHEVVISTVKLYQPPTYTCTCSQVQYSLSCDKPCCSQATISCVEHVAADTCEDLINQKDDNSKKEVIQLKSKPTKLKSKAQVQPSQDNRDHMVKKLEKGTYVTSIAHQQGQAKRNDLVQDQKGKHGTLHLFHEFQEQDKALKKRKVPCKDKGMLHMQGKRTPYCSMPHSAK